MDFFVADVQGFQREGRSNSFIPKQIAIKKFLDYEFYTCVLEPPYAWQDVPHEERNTHRYVEKHILNFRWSEGGETRDNATREILEMTKNCKQVFVKGMLKERWFVQLLGPSVRVVNVEAMSAPSLLEMQVRFPSCKVVGNKARTNVNLVENWLIASRLESTDV